jgi:hypothetical protein
MKPGPERTLPHSALAITSLVFGVLVTPVWLSLPIIEKTMSWGEPFGSVPVLIPALILAVLGSILGLAFGIGGLLRGISRSHRKQIGFAGIGVSLSLGVPLILWIYATVS